jgi:hypothetical protein
MIDEMFLALPVEKSGEYLHFLNNWRTQTHLDG